MAWRDRKDQLPAPLPQAGWTDSRSSTKSGCWGPHPSYLLGTPLSHLYTRSKAVIKVNSIGGVELMLNKEEKKTDWRKMLGNLAEKWGTVCRSGPQYKRDMNILERDQWKATKIKGLGHWQKLPREAAMTPPWRSSDVTWTWVWAPCSGSPCWAGVGADGHRDSANPSHSGTLKLHCLRWLLSFRLEYF